MDEDRAYSVVVERGFIVDLSCPIQDCRHSRKDNEESFSSRCSPGKGRYRNGTARENEGGVAG